MTDIPDIQILFPDCVATACMDTNAAEYALYQEEQHLVEHAVTKRRKEFAAGRTCARRALELLGIRGCPLPANGDGSVAWPQETVGAISHSHSWCGAAVARTRDARGLGLDIETIRRVNPRLEKKILTPGERDRLQRYNEQERQTLLCLFFSAKESVYKCLYPLLKVRMGFLDAVIVPQPQRQTFAVLPGEKASAHCAVFSLLAGQFFLHKEDVFTSVVLPSGETHRV